MRGPGIVFNRLSSLYFEIESSGGDDLSLPIRSPLIGCPVVAGEVLGRLGLPHEEGACLSPSLHTENEQEEDLFQG
jgi:hypothetical protein